MTATIKVTEPIVSCSDNGQHPLVYINLKNGSGRCQYCGKSFVHVGTRNTGNDKQAA